MALAEGGLHPGRAAAARVWFTSLTRANVPSGVFYIATASVRGARPCVHKAEVHEGQPALRLACCLAVA